MTANLENIHEIYNIFCQKNRMNADIINLFDHFHLSQTLRHLKMEKQQGVSASLLIVLLCLFRMCHESIGRLKQLAEGLMPVPAHRHRETFSHLIGSYGYILYGRVANPLYIDVRLVAHGRVHWFTL